jgi:large subunit ribosomal protein L22
MRAYLRSARIAPKKANLVADMVRGLPVEAAVTSLERTNKKAARMLLDLIRSAVANARHNDSQGAAHLIVKTLTVNKAQSYRRAVPMARGRVRPIRKYMSHIEVTLGLAGAEETDKKPKKEASEASQAAKKPVQKKQQKSATGRPAAERRTGTTRSATASARPKKAPPSTKS